MSRWRPERYASITLKRQVYEAARDMMRMYGMHSVAHMVDNALKLYMYVQEHQPGLIREANMWSEKLEAMARRGIEDEYKTRVR